MKKYKHYSFDLWMTLIRSNPAFKPERTRFFCDNFNSKGKTPEEVAVIFRQVDTMCNAINEKTGGNIHAEEMYLMVISAINDYDYSLQTVDIDALYLEMEALVLKHLPTAYEVDTIKTLRHLKANTGSTFSLLSNTAFIKGNTLRHILQHLEIDSLFEFQLYSDEVGMSKPHTDFFRLMVANTEVVRREKWADLKELVHVGDNPQADIYGAEKVGISSMLINSNHLTILNLLN